MSLCELTFILNSMRMLVLDKAARESLTGRPGLCPAWRCGPLARVLARQIGRGLLAPICGVLVLGVEVQMRVNGAIAVSVFVFMFDVFMGVSMRDAAQCSCS